MEKGWGWANFFLKKIRKLMTTYFIHSSNCVAVQSWFCWVENNFRWSKIRIGSWVVIVLSATEIEEILAFRSVWTSSLSHCPVNFFQTWVVHYNFTPVLQQVDSILILRRKRSGADKENFPRKITLRWFWESRLVGKIKIANQIVPNNHRIRPQLFLEFQYKGSFSTYHRVVDHVSLDRNMQSV